MEIRWDSQLLYCMVVPELDAQQLLGKTSRPCETGRSRGGGADAVDDCLI